MIQINPREIAAEALMEIIKEEAYNNVVLKRLLKQNGAMSPKDRAFVTEIVNGTLRNIIYIDYILDSVSTVKTTKMKPWIVAVLRSGVYQLYFMHVPDSAACNEAVKLVKKKGFGRLGGFVNGVLRNVIRQKDAIILPDEKKKPAEYLSVRYSHPIWLIKLWLKEFDYSFVKALCEKNNESTNVSVCYNPLKIEKENLKSALEDIGVSVSEGLWSKQALHLSKTADLAAMDYFQKGCFHVQDESSMLAVEILDPQKNDKILDLCAAPGGKSFLIAEKMENTGTVEARDIYEHKVQLIKDGANRLGLSVIQAKCQDASQFDSSSEQAFDKVLVDAPCSGLGLIRKKPDIRLHKTPEGIHALILLQREILEQAAKYVKYGGVLVYSTCTISKEENEDNIQWFLQSHEDYVLDDISPFVPAGLQMDEKKGWIALYPHMHNTDGFFITRMRRKEFANEK